MFPGGSYETGKNSIAPEHGSDTATSDRGTVPFDDDTSGADTATFDRIHSAKYRNCTKGTAPIYGYEDYTGVTFHPPKEPNAFAHGIKSISGTPKHKSEEYGPANLIKITAANFGEITISGDPKVEHTCSNYSTVDVAVAVSYIFVGAASYMGDPKTDLILTDGETTDPVRTGESGNKGTSVPSLDSINVECFGPITSECIAGKIPDSTPENSNKRTPAVIPVLNTYRA